MIKKKLKKNKTLFIKFTKFWIMNGLFKMIVFRDLIKIKSDFYIFMQYYILLNMIIFYEFLSNN